MSVTPAPESPGSVVVHDGSGHAFQMQLSRWLATQGIETTHVHCPSVESPKGPLAPRPDDPPHLTIRGLPMRRTFAKYSPGRRILQEVGYGVRLSATIRRIRPAVVLSGNTPLVAAAVLHLGMKIVGVPVVYWQQDIYSVAIADHLRSRIGRSAVVVGAVFTFLERFVVRASVAVVAISEDYTPTLRSWGVDPHRIHVIENWAPLGDLPVRARANPFSARHELDGRFVFLYAGTLGLKHDPSLLLRLAEHLEDRSDAAVVVASQGPGADWLRAHCVRLGGLVLLPYQPPEVLPEMLASADVVLAVLEPDAGSFSVPSKVLTYHCAGRPILASIGHDNLAARIVRREQSGLCVAPGDAEALCAAADALIADPSGRRQMGERARAYAERTFDIDRIGSQFLAVLSTASDARVRRRTRTAVRGRL